MATTNFTYQDPGGCNCPPGGCALTVCASACGGAALAGASVAVKSAGTTVASGTTGGLGCVTLAIPAAGAYEVIVSAAGYTTSDATYTVACGGTLAIKLATTANPPVVFTVTGCCSNVLPGATLTIDGATYTTDSNGRVKWGVTAAGTYPYTVTATRFATYSGSVTTTACQATANVNLTLTPASGYICGVAHDSAGNPTPYPIPTTLFGTDPAYGGFTIVSTGAAWYGTNASASFPGGCGCPAAPVTINYQLNGGCITPGTGASFQVSYGISTYAQCFGGTPLGVTTRCPNNLPDTCAGKPNGTMVLVGTGGGGPATVPTLVVSSGMPFAATVTYPATTCPGPGDFAGDFYPGGVTITLTE